MIFERGRNRKKFFLQPKPSVRIEDPSSHFLHSFATDRRSHTTSGGFDIVGEQYELKMYISEAYVFKVFITVYLKPLRIQKSKMVSINSRAFVLSSLSHIWPKCSSKNFHFVIMLAVYSEKESCLGLFLLVQR
jgi:hypothetical protein